MPCRLFAERLQRCTLLSRWQHQPGVARKRLPEFFRPLRPQTVSNQGGLLRLGEPLEHYRHHGQIAPQRIG
jgi:hypothetical protein